MKFEVRKKSWKKPKIQSLIISDTRFNEDGETDGMGGLGS